MSMAIAGAVRSTTRLQISLAGLTDTVANEILMSGVIESRVARYVPGGPDDQVQEEAACGSRGAGHAVEDKARGGRGRLRDRCRRQVRAERNQSLRRRMTPAPTNWSDGCIPPAGDGMKFLDEPTPSIGGI